MFIAGFSILLTILAVLLGTAVACVRAASRTRLIEALGEGGDTVDRFFRFRRQYARVLLLTQYSVIFGFACLLFHAFGRFEDTTLRWSLTGGTWIAWLIVFAVGVPVGWARHAGDAYMAAIIPTMELLRRALAPLLVVVGGVDEIVRRLAGAPREPVDRSEQLELEIMDAVSHGELSGMMNPAEKEIIRSALTLDETSVGEVMTPRTDIVGVESGANMEEVREAILSDGHSRARVRRFARPRRWNTLRQGPPAHRESRRIPTETCHADGHVCA
ncbi:MAG: hypothetical protein IPK83_14345 [Planctomycetes bacterium]|nr:hypothetical protein [Planctomycetota bacterium]